MRGGVAIFINPRFMSKEVFVECSCTSAYSCDSLSVIINPGKFQHLISVVYRSPSASVDDSRGLVNVLSDVRKQVRNCPWSIVGDFNLPNVTYGAVVRCTTCIHNKLLEFFEYNNLVQLVPEPTRGENILDLLWTNCAELYDNVSVDCPIASSDHNTVHARFMYLNELASKDKGIKCVRKFDLNYAASVLSNANWELIFHGLQSVDEYVDAFMGVIDIALPFGVQKYKVPTCIYKNRSLPKSIIKLIRKKKRLWCQMKKSRLAGKLDNEKKYLSYKIVCRQIKLRLRNHKRNILHGLAIEKDAKKFFNYVNGEIKSNKPIVHLTDSNGKRVDTDEQMANLFNEIFASNYVKSTACNSALGLNLTTDEISNSFMINVTYEETLRALRSSKSRAAGPDGISGDIIRNLAPLIAKPLHIIYLQSVGQHCFPSLWKCARVVPLFKGKGSRHDPLNYRCISLTNIFGKCLESIIKNQLVDYLEVNNLLHKAQHGFRAGCSTVTNLLVTDKYIAEWVNAGDEFDILSFDLSKAFDRVQHSVLLRKFKQLKFQNGAIKWFMDFLSNRTQYVSCGSARSATLPVKSGVVAGSVLGPVLFSIVIDSLPYELDAPLVMFADDFKVLINVTKMGIVRARSVVGIVRNWCEVNELDLSVSKSCCLHSKKILL